VCVCVCVCVCVLAAGHDLLDAVVLCYQRSRLVLVNETTSVLHLSVAWYRNRSNNFRIVYHRLFGIVVRAVVAVDKLQ